MKARTGLVWLALPAALLAAPAHAASLPAHRPLRILIVSDFVNPHSLPPQDLVEPGDLSRALLGAGSGLNLDPAADAVLEIPTNSIEQATALLGLPFDDALAYDVLVYFAHRIPDNGNGAQARQDDFTAAVDGFLGAGGGVVVYHHGAYESPGKAGILDLLGATARGAVPWNTVEGQNVIAVAPVHFVTTNGARFTGTLGYADPARGVPAGVYPYFNNRPDERYPSFDLNPTAGAIEVLWASDYDQDGTTHLLGYTHRRPAWCGVVVAYQPGEYEPNMLDAGGVNFQVIANEIVYAARARSEDRVSLRAVKGAAAAAQLSWSGAEPCWSVYRSSDRRAIAVPAARIGQSPAPALTDSPPPGTLWYYQATSP